MGLRDRGDGLHWRVADHWRFESSGKKAKYENWGREQPANNEEHCAFIWASEGLGKAWRPWGLTEIGTTKIATQLTLSFPNPSTPNSP